MYSLELFYRVLFIELNCEEDTDQRTSTLAKDWSVPRLFSTNTSYFPASDSFAFLMVSSVLVSPTSKKTLKDNSTETYKMVRE